MKIILLLSFIQLLIIESNALYCYQCVSTQPGCGTPFNWHWRFWGNPCPEDNDICVKIIERKDANEVITRECLSNLKGFRTDIPADRYEGCRPAAVDVKLSNYVNHTVKEHDVKRNYYDSTTWCFCFLDHRCNSATTNLISALLLISSVIFCFNL